jgi:hypothetical protein
VIKSSFGLQTALFILTIRKYTMKTLCVVIALTFSVLSFNAAACPKGTHPVGGTGPHHKGGTCR